MHMNLDMHMKRKTGSHVFMGLLLALTAGFALAARAQGTATWMTYNIKGHAISEARLANIGKVIACNQPDVVAIQEVDNRDALGRKKDNLALLAKSTGMKAWFHALVGTYYGVGLLAREEPLSVEYRTWERGTNSTDRENRGAIIAQFADYYFISTHYSLNADDRDKATADIIKFARYADKPVLVAGDFNAAPTYRAMVTFRNNGFKILNDVSQYSFPSDNATSCIDMVLLYDGTGTFGCRVEESGVALSGGVNLKDASVSSDHLPVFVTAACAATGITATAAAGNGGLTLSASALHNGGAQTARVAVYSAEGRMAARGTVAPGQSLSFSSPLPRGLYLVRGSGNGSCACYKCLVR